MLKDLRNNIDYRWKIGTQNKAKTKFQCVAYIDARDVMDTLDEIVGPENWTNEFYEIKGVCYCKIGIRTGDIWVYKSDCGTPSDYESIKGEASDAFKRAAVKRGIGRFLYELGTVRITKEESDSNKYNLTEFIEKKIGNKKKPEIKAASYLPNIDHLKKLAKFVKDRKWFSKEEANQFKASILSGKRSYKDSAEALKAITEVFNISENHIRMIDFYMTEFKKGTLDSLKTNE